VTFTPSPPDTSSNDPAEEPVHPLIAFEFEPENKITVPEDLRIKRPAIAQTKAYWAAQKRGEVKYNDNKLPFLSIVSKETLPRPSAAFNRSSSEWMPLPAPSDICG